ncbi:peroxisomal biogenesis factor 11 [Phlyctochytrium arcticum]|nr:peroxisomal biogenesis factor 11 [Phlyctochytrium arcticum]
MNALISTKTHDQTVKFLSTTTGRDRIHRFVQYFARFLIWHGQRHGYEENTLERLTKLMGSVSQTRKLMRVGRQIEFARNIQKASSAPDDTTRTLATIKNTFMALWLMADTCQWANTAGVVKFDSIKEITKRGMKCWLIALIASFMSGLHQMRQTARRIETEKKALQAGKVDDKTAHKNVVILRAAQAKLQWNLVQDGLDMLLPASGLEYVKVESGIVGLIGAFTSIMGGVTQWKSVA